MYSGLGYSSYHIGPHFQVTLALCIYSKTSLIRAAWVTGVPVTKNCPYVRIFFFIKFNIILLLYLSFRFIQRGRIICDLVRGNQPYAIKIDFELLGAVR